jgi:phenylacetate-coenzyme A ligase PaaK-like adenylate-forming protein
MLLTFAYHHSPVWAQESLLATRSALRHWLREGPLFDSFLNEARKTQWLSEHELGDYQARKLRTLIGAAAVHVPYYRKRFDALGLDVERLRFPHDLARLPLLTRRDVQEAGDELISKEKLGPLLSSSTSGTSGAPLALYQDLAAINRENAFIWRQLEWAGVRRGERRAWIRGDMIVAAAQSKPPYWRLNRVENMLMLSSYHLSEAAVVPYLDALTRFDPVVVQAYPSSIGFLATWLRSNGLRYRGASLRAIVTSSETVSADARNDIERAFGCRLFDWYGQGERVAAIGTCEWGRHHLLGDYACVELLPAGDGLYELCGTGFNNRAMPLIRYRCGDYVRPAPPGEHCRCGRALPLIAEVLGRVDDAVKLPDGRSIGRLDHIFKGLEGIIEAQIRQQSIDAITVLVVALPSFDERRLIANARERLGNEIAIDVRRVDAVPRTSNGKLKGVVCTV